MPIPYILIKNHLSEDPDDYYAFVQSIGVLSEEDIVDRMLSRGTTINRVDILGVLKLYTAEIETALLQGYRIHTELVNFSSRISGTFSGPDDVFSAERHKVQPGVNGGRSLRRAFRKGAPVTRRERIPPKPAPQYLKDVGSGELNSLITPGGMGVLHGSLLKFNPDDPEQGIFLTSGDNMEVRVEAVAVNYPGELVFAFPGELASGEYRLEVRVRGGKGTRICTGELNSLLSPASG